MGNSEEIGFALGTLDNAGNGNVEIAGDKYQVERWDITAEPFEVIEDLEETYPNTMNNLYLQLNELRYAEYLRRVSTLREEGFFSHKKVVYVHERYSPESTYELEQETPERFGRTDWYAKLKWMNSVFPEDERHIAQAYDLYEEIMG